MIVLCISVFIGLFYCGLIVWFSIGFNRIKTTISGNQTPNYKFSVLVPFRNEAENLPNLLDSFLHLDYPIPFFEIILINDNSNDNSKHIILEFCKQHEALNLKLIENIRSSNSPKKDALTIAVQKSSYDWIVTTDADCIVPKNWLRSFDAFIQETNPKMICGPVSYTSNHSFFENFQLLDFSGLMATTIGAFGIKKSIMCNGANLCYSKETFNAVNGYTGNNHLASGDDVFLLEKIKNAFSGDVHFLKSRDALVKTNPTSTLKALIFQRVRWASKTSNLRSGFIKIVGLIVFGINSWLLTLLVLALLNYSSVNLILLMLFLVKVLVDFILLLKFLSFSEQLKVLIFYPLASVFHPLFSFITAFLAIFKFNFSWKDK